MKLKTSLIASLCVASLALVLLGGCEEPAGEEYPTMPNTPGNENASTTTGSNLGETRNSTLGKARGSAQDLVNQAQQDSQNLANEIDKTNQGDR